MRMHAAWCRSSIQQAHDVRSLLYGSKVSLNISLCKSMESKTNLKEQFLRFLQISYRCGQLMWVMDRHLSWVPFMNFARFSEEQNVEVFLNECSFYFRTIRRVAPGEELLIWPTEGLGRRLKIPKLVIPKTEQRKKRFVDIYCTSVANERKNGNLNRRNTILVLNFAGFYFGDLSREIWKEGIKFCYLSVLNFIIFLKKSELLKIYW